MHPNNRSSLACHPEAQPVPQGGKGSVRRSLGKLDTNSAVPCHAGEQLVPQGGKAPVLATANGSNSNRLQIKTPRPKPTKNSIAE